MSDPEIFCKTVEILKIQIRMCLRFNLIIGNQDEGCFELFCFVEERITKHNQFS